MASPSDQHGDGWKTQGKTFTLILSFLCIAPVHEQIKWVVSKESGSLVIESKWRGTITLDGWGGWAYLTPS
jgi:hypothetical protein